MSVPKLHAPEELRGNEVITEAQFEEPSPPSLFDVCADFSQKLRQAGLNFGTEHDRLVRTFVSSLATKGFVILSGLSGAGKTQIAIAFGEWLGSHRLHVEAVRPNWTSPDALLGFEDISSESMDARHAWKVPRSLEFILSAARDPRSPYVLLLDEMNLAHVEQYFADVLSGMESNQPVVPNLHYEAGRWRMPVDDVPYIPWPSNLFIVGTVNNDETTYQFSPKVIDRANTIEFRVPPGSLRASRTPVRHVERGDPRLVRNFLKRAHGQENDWATSEQLASGLELLHEVLYGFGAEFGHRVFRDAMRLGSFLAESGETDYRVVLDYVIVQKIMPKFELKSERQSNVLLAIARFACPEIGRVDAEALIQLKPANPPLPHTLDKVQSILRSTLRPA